MIFGYVFQNESRTLNIEQIAYLNAALEESLKGDAESQHLFLTALRNIAEAQGGIGNLDCTSSCLFYIIRTPHNSWRLVYHQLMPCNFLQSERGS